MPAYVRTAKTFRKYVGDNPTSQDSSTSVLHWEFFGDAEPVFKAWRSKNRQLVSVVADAGWCSGFAGRLWALFEVRGSELRLLNSPGSKDEPEEFNLVSIVDMNHDGLAEVLGGDWRNAGEPANALLRGTPQGPRLVGDVYAPFHDCGC